MASRLYEILRKYVFSDIKTGPRLHLLPSILSINCKDLNVWWEIINSVGGQRYGIRHLSMLLVKNYNISISSGSLLHVFFSIGGQRYGIRRLSIMLVKNYNILISSGALSQGYFSVLGKQLTKSVIHFVRFGMCSKQPVTYCRKKHHDIVGYIIWWTV